MCFSNVSANVSGVLGTFQQQNPSGPESNAFDSDNTGDKVNVSRFLYDEKTGNTFEFETLLFIFQHIPESCRGDVLETFRPISRTKSLGRSHPLFPRRLVSNSVSFRLRDFVKHGRFVAILSRNSFSCLRANRRAFPLRVFAHRFPKFILLRAEECIPRHTPRRNDSKFLRLSPLSEQQSAVLRRRSYTHQWSIRFNRRSMNFSRYFYRMRYCAPLVVSGSF